MITTLRTISTQEAEVFLWQKLGDLRSWPAFLNDNRRKKGPKQDIRGYTLLPCARMFDGTKKPPLYSLADVVQFIDNVKACTTGTKPGKYSPMTLNIDDALPWGENTFDQAGTPVALVPVVVMRKRKCSIFAGSGAIGSTRWGSFAKPTKTRISSRRSGGLSAPLMH